MATKIDGAARRRQALEIYTNYIAPGSPYEVVRAKKNNFFGYNGLSFGRTLAVERARLSWCTLRDCCKPPLPANTGAHPTLRFQATDEENAAHSRAVRSAKSHAHASNPRASSLLDFDSAASSESDDVAPISGVANSNAAPNGALFSSASADDVALVAVVAKSDDVAVGSSAAKSDDVALPAMFIDGSESDEFRQPSVVCVHRFPVFSVCLL